MSVIDEEMVLQAIKNKCTHTWLVDERKATCKVVSAEEDDRDGYALDSTGARILGLKIEHNILRLFVPVRHDYDFAEGNLGAIALIDHPAVHELAQGYNQCYMSRRSLPYTPPLKLVQAADKASDES